MDSIKATENAVNLGAFVGYGAPIFVLLGWYPMEPYLWITSVLILYVFVVYWFDFYFTKNEDDFKTKARRSKIMAFMYLLVVLADYIIVVFLGVILHLYSSHGQSQALVLISVVVKCTYTLYQHQPTLEEHAPVQTEIQIVTQPITKKKKKERKVDHAIF